MQSVEVYEVVHRVQYSAPLYETVLDGRAASHVMYMHHVIMVHVQK
jgi:hypothetical protein